MERESRFSQWLRRRSRSAGGGAAEDAARVRENLLLASAAAGFPLAPAAHPEGYGCSCERIGCPTPGRHPLSFAWQTQASTDPEQIERWARNRPQANFITATGLAHDVLDVPAEAGRAALERLETAAIEVGPVALSGHDRMLFFTATRGTPADEDEWWPCELDCHPETMDEHPGLRWHCRGSYVLVPPAQLLGEVPLDVSWVRAPERPLPDPLTLLEALTDACAAYADEKPDHDPAPWPAR
ncbi:bifunctional DNA primase/polymerase [Streptomyces gobiensis]|uniref:bifunctional DNA primase/polymerase n=1 Tax=Streptomyces gobiensis TaxID=2875706 RepID=UPI001E654770|nr:bifunctional DNA primase/polymerase [Streptomyces gobiensis]UGY91078.1 bifunctional DNA primase/polymerase [Streptomyces gobiensis]